MLNSGMNSINMVNVDLRCQGRFGIWRIWSAKHWTASVGIKMKREAVQFTFYNKEGAVLLDGKLLGMPLREETVLKLSVEFFRDPEPCMAHRSAVMGRMYMELIHYFSDMKEKGQSSHLFSELPPRLASFIDLKDVFSVTAAFL
jgi:hypothetical protein